MTHDELCALLVLVGFEYVKNGVTPDGRSADMWRYYPVNSSPSFTVSMLYRERAASNKWYCCYVKSTIKYSSPSPSKIWQWVRERL